jgi:lipopolysaccharide export system protein LptA
MTPHRISALAGVLGLLLSGTAGALSSDRQQPLQIDADKADIDQQHGVSTYRGNVHLTRGSMQLFADEVVVKHDGGTIHLVTATGSPASYQQLSDKQQMIRARAQRMEYNIDTGQLLLLKGAELHQDTNVFASERIVYDSISDRVNAGADAASPQDRVHITIQPGADSKAPQ